MSHLVEPINNEVPLQVCYERVQAAHKFLVEHAKQAVKKLCAVNDKNWGVECKRTPVDLTEGGPSIGKDITKHSLIEIINQCATMERLLDTLEWAQTPESGFSEYKVMKCHPTTSSATGENDLMLISKNGKKAHFEIADVASDKDGNRKEEKSLIALKVLQDESGNKKMKIQWPTARLFMVVSTEFSTKIRKSMKNKKCAWFEGDTPHCHYDEKVPFIGSTVIFEVCHGSGQ